MSQGGILCSERGQSRDAFQATPLEETSPRCNKLLVLSHIPLFQVPVKAVEGKLYVRISAHMYNELSEYKTLGEAILDIVEKNIYKATQ